MPHAISECVPFQRPTPADAECKCVSAPDFRPPPRPASVSHPLRACRYVAARESWTKDQAGCILAHEPTTSATMMAARRRFMEVFSRRRRRRHAISKCHFVRIIVRPAGRPVLRLRSTSHDLPAASASHSSGERQVPGCSLPERRSMTARVPPVPPRCDQGRPAPER
jgi:hypothetical protein